MYLIKIYNRAGHFVDFHRNADRTVMKVRQYRTAMHLAKELNAESELCFSVDIATGHATNQCRMIHA